MFEFGESDSYNSLRSSRSTRKTIRDKNKSGKRNVLPLHKIRLILSTLHEYADIPIRDLPEEIEKKFEEFKEIVRKTNNQTRTSLVNEVDSYFDKDRYVVPGTILAYMIGCFSYNDVPININCTMACIDSLSLPSDVGGNIGCKHHVLMYDGDEIVFKNRIKSHKAVVHYTGDEQFKINSKLENFLTKSETKSLTVVSYDSRGRYDGMLYDNVRIGSHEEESSSGGFFGLFLILFIFIVIVLIVLSRR